MLGSSESRAARALFLSDPAAPLARLHPDRRIVESSMRRTCSNRIQWTQSLGTLCLGRLGPRLQRLKLMPVTFLQDLDLW